MSASRAPSSLIALHPHAFRGRQPFGEPPQADGPVPAPGHLPGDAVDHRPIPGALVGAECLSAMEPPPEPGWSAPTGRSSPGWHVLSVTGAVGMQFFVKEETQIGVGGGREAIAAGLRPAQASRASALVVRPVRVTRRLGEVMRSTTAVRSNPGFWKGPRLAGERAGQVGYAGSLESVNPPTSFADQRCI